MRRQDKLVIKCRAWSDKCTSQLWLMCHQPYIFFCLVFLYFSLLPLSVHISCPYKPLLTSSALRFASFWAAKYQFAKVTSSMSVTDPLFLLTVCININWAGLRPSGFSLPFLTTQLKTKIIIFIPLILFRSVSNFFSFTTFLLICLSGLSSYVLIYDSFDQASLKEKILSFNTSIQIYLI